MPSPTGTVAATSPLGEIARPDTLKPSYGPSEIWRPSTPSTTENTISAPSGTGATPSAARHGDVAPGRRPAAGRPPRGGRRGAATRRRSPASPARPTDGWTDGTMPNSGGAPKPAPPQRTRPPRTRTTPSPTAPPPARSRPRARRRAEPTRRRPDRRSRPRTRAPRAPARRLAPEHPPVEQRGPRRTARRRPRARPRAQPLAHARQRKKNRDDETLRAAPSCPCYIRLPLPRPRAVRQKPWSFTWSHARHSPLRLRATSQHVNDTGPKGPVSLPAVGAPYAGRT